jgi:hypothetical protein
MDFAKLRNVLGRMQLQPNLKSAMIGSSISRWIFLLPLKFRSFMDAVGIGGL